MVSDTLKQFLLPRSVTTTNMFLPQEFLLSVTSSLPIPNLRSQPFSIFFQLSIPLLYQPYHPIPKSPPPPPWCSSLPSQLLQHLHSCTRLTICNSSHDSSPNITDQDYSLLEKLQWNLHLFLEDIQAA